MSNRRKERKQKARNERLERDMQKRQEAYDNKSKKLSQKYGFKSVIDNLRFETYTKRLVAIITGIGLIDIQLSYILAFLGYENIAETLSVQMCTTILGTALIYMIRAYFDTKAEKADKKTSNMNKDMEKEILNKVEDVFIKAGITIPSDFNTTNISDRESPDIKIPDDWEEYSSTINDIMNNDDNKDD